MESEEEREDECVLPLVQQAALYWDRQVRGKKKQIAWINPKIKGGVR